MRRLAPIVAAVIVSVLLIASGPGAVLASCNPVSNDPARNVLNTGQIAVAISETPGGTVQGVYSYILNYSPYVPSGQWSYAWSMLTKGVNWTWAQVGNDQEPSGRYVRVSTANGNSGSVTNNYWPAQPLGSYTEYEVLYNPVQLYFAFYAGSSLLWTDYGLSWTPTAAQVAAEISDLNTQMMGGRNSHEIFTSNSIVYGGHPWQAMTGSPFHSGPYGQYFGMSGTGSQFNSWDTDCPQ